MWKMKRKSRNGIQLETLPGGEAGPLTKRPRGTEEEELRLQGEERRESKAAGDETARRWRQEGNGKVNSGDDARWRKSKKRVSRQGDGWRQTKEERLWTEKGKMRTVTEKRRVSGTICAVPNIARLVSRIFSNADVWT